MGWLKFGKESFLGKNSKQTRLIVGDWKLSKAQLCADEKR